MVPVGLGAGLFDFSLSVVVGFILAGVPGALGAGLGAALVGAGLEVGAGLGAVLVGVALVIGLSELTLPVLAGLMDPSPLSVLGAGLRQVQDRES